MSFVSNQFSQTGNEGTARLDAEIARLREACDRARTQAEHLAARVRETEAKLARVRELCAASLGRDDYGFCPQDVLAAIEVAP